MSDPDRLRRMADEHLHEPFPDSVPKDDIGEVFSAMIDADIYGCALRRLDGTLTEADVDWLRDAAERLARSLPLFPSDGQPYFQRVLNLAHETLKD